MFRESSLSSLQIGLGHGVGLVAGNNGIEIQLRYGVQYSRPTQDASTVRVIAIQVGTRECITSRNDSQVREVHIRVAARVAGSEVVDAGFGVADFDRVVFGVKNVRCRRLTLLWIVRFQILLQVFMRDDLSAILDE